MNKTKQFLAYLIQNNPAVPITSLMKLSYLIDLVSMKKTKRKISNFIYKRYKYGPFDNRIYNILKELEQTVVVEDVAYSHSGDEYIVYKYKEGVDFSFDQLAERERKIISEVLSTVRGYGAKALTELTYKTKPMIKIKAQIENDAGLNQILDLKAS